MTTAIGVLIDPGWSRRSHPAVGPQGTAASLRHASRSARSGSRSRVSLHWQGAAAAGSSPASLTPSGGAGHPLAVGTMARALVESFPGPSWPWQAQMATHRCAGGRDGAPSGWLASPHRRAQDWTAAAEEVRSARQSGGSAPQPTQPGAILEAAPRRHGTPRHRLLSRSPRGDPGVGGGYPPDGTRRATGRRGIGRGRLCTSASLGRPGRGARRLPTTSHKTPQKTTVPGA